MADIKPGYHPQLHKKELSELHKMGDCGIAKWLRVYGGYDRPITETGLAAIGPMPEMCNVGNIPSGYVAACAAKVNCHNRLLRVLNNRDTYGNYSAYRQMYQGLGCSCGCHRFTESDYLEFLRDSYAYEQAEDAYNSTIKEELLCYCDWGYPVIAYKSRHPEDNFKLDTTLLDDADSAACNPKSAGADSVHRNLSYHKLQYRQLLEKKQRKAAFNTETRTKSNKAAKATQTEVNQNLEGDEGQDKDQPQPQKCEVGRKHQRHKVRRVIATLNFDEDILNYE